MKDWMKKKYPVLKMVFETSVTDPGLLRGAILELAHEVERMSELLEQKQYQPGLKVGLTISSWVKEKDAEMAAGSD